MRTFRCPEHDARRDADYVDEQLVALVALDVAEWVLEGDEEVQGQQEEPQLGACE